MKCNNCGAENADGSRFCTNCGAALDNNAVDAGAQQYAQNVQYAQNPQNMQYAQPMQGAPMFNGQNAQYMQYNQYNQAGQYQQLTKEEFINLPAMEKQKKNANACAIICYVCAVITLIAQLVGGGFPIDAVILGVLGGIIHWKKSFIASVILLAYSIFNFVICVFVLQTGGGWLIIVAGVYAVVTTYKMNKAYKNYTSTGVVPTENVA